MADLSKYSDDDLERIANQHALANMSDADLEKLAAGKKSAGIGDTIVDMVRSLPGGLTKGITGLVGLPGTLFNPTETEAVEGLGGEPITVNKGAHRGLPTGEGIDKVVSQPFGGYYEPKTGLGQFTERAAEFAPSVIGGPASLGTRLMGRVLAPAAGSVAAEDLVKSDNPAVRAGAQIGGALLGAGTFGGVRALSQAVRNARLSPEEIASAHVRNVVPDFTRPEDLPNYIPGVGQTVAEASGPRGVANLAALGRRSGDTAPNLATYLQQRAEGQPGRLLDNYSAAAGIHPEAAQGNIDQLVAAGRASVRPQIREILQRPGGVMSESLQELSQRPIIRRAMAKAAEDIRNAGDDPNRIGLFFDEAGNATQVSHPTAEAWDLVKKAVGQSVERDAFGRRLPDSVSPGNYRIGEANRELSRAMSDAIPGYGDFLRESGDYLSLQSAFDAGMSHIMAANVTPAQVARHLADMTTAEQAAYRAGIGNRLNTMAQNGRLRPNQLLTPAIQSKLRSALGERQAQQFIDSVVSERAISQTGQRMMPGTGSITSDVLNATREQDLSDTVRGASHFARAAGDLAANRYGSAIANVLRGGYHFAPDMFRTGGMTEAARNRAGQLLMLPPEEYAQQLQALPAPRPNMGAAALAPYLLRSQ